MGTSATVRLIEGVRLIRCPLNTGFTVFESCLSKVYEIRVFKVYLEIERWRLGKANLMGMTACGSDWKKTNGLFVGDNINLNQNISTQH